MRVMHMISNVVAAKVSEAVTGGDGIGRFGQRADEHARWIIAFRCNCIFLFYLPLAGYIISVGNCGLSFTDPCEAGSSMLFFRGKFRTLELPDILLCC
jgi:hypothetical protein